MHWKPRSGHRFRGAVLARGRVRGVAQRAGDRRVLDRVGAGPRGRAGPPPRHRDQHRRGRSGRWRSARRASSRSSSRGRTRRDRPARLGGRPALHRSASGAATTMLFDATVPEDPNARSGDRRYDRLVRDRGPASPDQRGSAPTGGRPLDERLRRSSSPDMMAAVVTSRGTASSAAAAPRSTRGRQDRHDQRHNTDAWFVGFTGRVLAAVWLGFDDPARKLGARGRRRARRAAAVDPRDPRRRGQPPAADRRARVRHPAGMEPGRRSIVRPGWSRLPVQRRAGGVVSSAGTAPTEVSPDNLGHQRRTFGRILARILTPEPCPKDSSPDGLADRSIRPLPLCHSGSGWYAAPACLEWAAARSW